MTKHQAAGDDWYTPAMRASDQALVGTWYRCRAHEVVSVDDVVHLGDQTYCAKDDCTEAVRLVSRAKAFEATVWKKSPTAAPGTRGGRLAAHQRPPAKKPRPVGPRVPGPLFADAPAASGPVLAAAPESSPPPAAPVQAPAQVPVDQVDSKPPKSSTPRAPRIHRESTVPASVAECVRRFLATSKANTITWADACLVARAAFPRDDARLVNNRVGAALATAVERGELVRKSQGVYARPGVEVALAPQREQGKPQQDGAPPLSGKDPEAEVVREPAAGPVASPTPRRRAPRPAPKLEPITVHVATSLVRCRCDVCSGAIAPPWAYVVVADAGVNARICSLCAAAAEDTEIRQAGQRAAAVLVEPRRRSA